jgi:hypothetical protein
MDEERIVKSATGIRNTVVWKKLFKFQRDGVVGAIDKLARFGGCIIADSVGLGKTFEALAVIKYHELRNDRVLVLAPKRLRDNWTLYKANDKRNVLAADRFNYDVLNHTDLSRDGGHSGDIDLSHVNWGNYDLVVIDESHNFRNKKSPRQGHRDALRPADAQDHQGRGQDPRADAVGHPGQQPADRPAQSDRLRHRRRRHGAGRARHRQHRADHAQGADPVQPLAGLDEAERTPGRLVEMLGFDYFTLLDHLTIARSRRHIEKYYGTRRPASFQTACRPSTSRPTWTWRASSAPSRTSTLKSGA